jgi:hypothetical protein
MLVNSPAVDLDGSPAVGIAVGLVVTQLRGLLEGITEGPAVGLIYDTTASSAVGLAVGPVVGPAVAPPPPRNRSGPSCEPSCMSWNGTPVSLVVRLAECPL